MSYRQELRELAFDTHGVVTLHDAEDVGVPAVEVRKLAARGALERIGYGVYRMLEVPRHPLDEYAEAVACVGPGAALADESVLAAHDLALVNPRRIRVVVPRRTRVRRAVPPVVQVICRDLPEHDLDHLEGIRAMTVPAALLAVRGHVMRERLIDAVHDAERRGIIGVDDERHLLDALAPVRAR